MEQTTQTRHEIKYSKILLNEVPREFYRPFEFRPGEVCDVPDFSSLQFLIEEFIALSATKIVIPKGSECEGTVEYLHPLMKKDVIIVDKKFQSYKSYGAILSPVQNEFQVKMTTTDHPGVLALHIERTDVSNELRNAISFLFFNLRTFVLGLENEAQIKMDLNEMKRAVDVVRLKTEQPETRIMLANLLGLFNTYEQHEIASLILTSSDYAENLDRLERLVNDQLYRNMSYVSHGLGTPAMLQDAKAKLMNIAKKAVTKEPYKHITTMAIKMISAVGHFPFELEWISSLLKKPYMPPIVSFDRAVQKAQEAWQSADIPVFGTLKGYFPVKDFSRK